MAEPAGEAPRRRSRRPVLVAALVVLALLVVVTGWLAFRGLQAATSLRSVADGAREIQADVRAGRTDGLAESVAAIRADAARAGRATSDPVWSLAEVLPVVGGDATAVRVVAQGLDDLATHALTPLADVAEGLDPAALRPVDGRIDLAPLSAAAPALVTASRVADRVQGDVADLDPAALHGPLVDPVTELQDGLTAAADALGTAARVASLLPPMLGADGPREYLVLFLNSAELRAQGGIVGALALVTADDGALALTDQLPGSEVPRFSDPVLPLTDAELAIMGEDLGRFVPNTVMVPDSPRAAQIAAEMYRRASGRTVDGVVLVDPVALSYVLGATGDVHHPDGQTLTAATLVQTLLLDAYVRETEEADSDAFFADAAGATFRALAEGAGDPAQLVDALRRSSDEHRLSVWSADPGEQALIQGSAVDGAFLTGGHDDAVGVFLDNASGWKTDTFLRSSVTVEDARCTDGRLVMDVVVDLASTVPADPGDLPRYVVGDGSTGVAVGDIRQRVSVYSPVGGTVAQIRRGESFLGAAGTTMAGRDVRVLTETLAPGESVTLRLTVTAPAPGPQVAVWSTPTTTQPGLASAPTGCGAD